METEEAAYLQGYNDGIDAIKKAFEGHIARQLNTRVFRTPPSTDELLDHLQGGTPEAERIKDIDVTKLGLSPELIAQIVSYNQDVLYPFLFEADFAK